MVESFRLTLEHELQAGTVDIFNVRLSEDNSHLLLGTSSGFLQLFDSSYTQTRTLNCQSGAEKMPVTSIRFRPEFPELARKPTILSTTCDGGINHWNLLNGKSLNVTRLRNEQIYSSDYNPDGTAYALGCKEGRIKVFDENTLQQQGVLTHGVEGEDPGAQRVFCLKWFDQHTIISGGWDNKITVWDTRSMHSVRELFGPHICGDSIDVRENIIVSGSYHIKDQLQVWSLENGTNIHTLTLEKQGKKCMPYAVQFCKPEGYIFAIGGIGSGEIYFYNAMTMELVNTLTGIQKTVYSIHRNNQKLAIAIGNSVNVYLTS